MLQAKLSIISKGAVLLGIGMVASCRSSMNHSELVLASFRSNPRTGNVKVIDPKTGKFRSFCGSDIGRSCIAAVGTVASGAVLMLIDRHGKGGDVPKLAVLSDASPDPVPVTGDEFPDLEEGIGSLSPDGTKVVFPIFEKGNRHSSIWIRNLSQGTSQQVTLMTTGDSWDYFPNWMGDGSGVVFHHMSRTDSGMLESRIDGYRLDTQSAMSLSTLGPVASIAYQFGKAKVFAAWTAAGLKVFRDDGDTSLIIPMSWCAGRILSPGTLTWNTAGDRIMFTLFDKAKNSAELYEVNVSTYDPRLIATLSGQQAMNLSITRNTADP